MPDLPEAWDAQDDWTGVTNSTERRRRQNRIGQRLYRRRRHLKRFATTVSSSSQETNSVASGVAEDGSSKGEELPVVVVRTQPEPLNVVNYAEGFMLVLCPQNREKAIEFVQRFFADFRLGVYKPGDLWITIHLNVLSAWCHNALALAIPFEDLESDDSISPFNFHHPIPPGTVARTSSVPVNLHPTWLQRTMVHHPWVDLIPVPQMRDNILCGLETSLFDEDELCRELAGAENNDGDMQLSFLVWGEAWDIKSWELSAGFFSRWRFLVQGCPEILETTNFWREKRGEPRIEMIEDF
ncbi:hypothetical protein EYR41_012047 [Orbilia oligospora]|uniref:BZIP domain-containing protein n=1 Tax=Orbilia oligospora TaxID=2813651 RepID=A0A8H2HKS2_ORBOL|nr:hypothetical protein EYR41_012047 [Orbilia oligospora]